MISLFKTYQVVPTPCDRYESVKNRRRPVQAPNAESIARYEADLDQLTKVLPTDQFPWYLEGGMALAAHLGGFRRRHSDADIGVFADSVPALEDYLAQHNYGLFSRNSGFKSLEYTPLDIVRATSADEIVSDRQVKRLTAMKIDDCGRAECATTVLPRFDIHVHYRGKNVVHVMRAKHAFPADLFHANGTYLASNGAPITVASVPFIYFFKLLGRRPKEQFDRHLIERSGLISPVEASRVRAVLPNRSVLKPQQVGSGQPSPLLHPA